MERQASRKCSTRMGMLIKLEDKTAEHVARRLAEHVVRLPAELVRSLTWDQGTEFAGHARFSVATNMPVFFADPHSPWQRGSRSNTNIASTKVKRSSIPGRPRVV